MSAAGAVFLDAGGVLLGPRPDYVAPVLEGLGVRADGKAVHRAHYAGVAAWDAAPVPEEAVWEVYFSAFAAESGVPEDRLTEAVPLLWEAFRRPGSWRRALPGAQEAVAAIAAMGVEIVIVSNSAGHVEDDLRSAGVCQVGSGPGVPVRRVLDSHLVGVAKPDPGIFEIALEAAGVVPERAVHVGDTVTADVRGAEAAGVRPLHLDPYGWCVHSGHDHIRTLLEVTAHL